MTSDRPYLIRALYEWILDNKQTPYLLINAEHEQVTVPHKFIEDGRIILNIAPEAVQDLELGNEWILFSARFSGKPFNIQVPVSAVIAIYARESGRGMIFPEDDGSTAGVDNEAQDGDEQTRGKVRAPHLTIVK